MLESTQDTFLSYLQEELLTGDLYTPLLNKLIAPKDFEATETNCKMDLECNVQ